MYMNTSVKYMPVVVCVGLWPIILLAFIFSFMLYALSLLSYVIFIDAECSLIPFFSTSRL
jgi:hypothetical protein